MLCLAGENGIKDPVKTEDGVEDHGQVVHPRSLVAEDVAQEGMFRVRIAKT